MGLFRFECAYAQGRREDVNSVLPLVSSGS